MKGYQVKFLWQYAGPIVDFEISKVDYSIKDINIFDTIEEAKAHGLKVLSVEYSQLLGLIAKIDNSIRRYS